MKYFLLVVTGLFLHVVYFFTRIIPFNERGDIFGGGDSAASDVKIPTWEADPLYQKSQDVLFPFASDILAGKPNEYFAPIGQSGSPEFENMMSLVNRDTSKAVNENLAKRGIGRGGLGASIAAKSAAEVNTKLRWSDFERAIQGKGFLLSTGSNIMSGVRSGATTNQGQINEFNLGATKLQLAQAQAEDEAKAKEDEMWGNLLKAGIGAAAIIATGGAATPLVLGAGAMGSAAGSFASQDMGAYALLNG